MVTTDFPEGIALRLDCLRDRESGGERKADREVRIGRHSRREGRKDVRGGREGREREVFIVRGRQNRVPNSITE